MELIDDKSVDAIITDVPYQITACKWDKIIPFKPMWERLNRVIKPNGAVALFGSEPFSSALRMSNIKNYKYDWIWEKQQGTGHLNAKKQPLRDSEDICVFYKKQPLYNPQMRFTGITTNGIVKAKRKNLNDSVYRKGIVGNTSWIDSGYRYPTQTLDGLYDKKRFDSSKKSRENRHPTQKPVALIEYLTKTYTNENELVLDFTAGSFTTSIASIRTNRRSICIEKDLEYYKLGVNRVKEELRQEDMFRYASN